VDDVIVLAGEVAFRALDLDDARPGIGEPAGALRRRHGLFDGNDEETL
jgi:hypothetical protein